MKNIIEDIKRLLKGVAEKGFFHLLSANILIQIVAFGAQLFVAKILPIEDIARIKLIQTLIGFFTIIGSFGFASSTLKLCSENRSEAYKKMVLNSGLFFTLFSSILSYLLLVTLVKFRLITADTTIVDIAPLAFLPIILMPIFSILTAYLQARKEIQLLSYLTTGNKILTIVLIIAFSYYLGLIGYFTAISLGYALILFSILYRIRNVLHHPKNLRTTTLTHWQYAKPSFFAGILGEATAYVDILIINALVPDLIEIGYYSFALTLTVTLRIFPATVQQITIPYFSEKSNDMVEHKRIFKKYSRLLILIIIGTFTLFIVGMPIGINLLFAKKYAPAISYLLPLGIAWSIRQYNQIQTAALFGIGKINYIAYSQMISLIINITITYTATILYGIYATAWALILCSIINVTTLRLFYRKAVKI